MIDVVKSETLKNFAVFTKTNLYARNLAICYKLETNFCVIDILLSKMILRLLLLGNDGRFNWLENCILQSRNSTSRLLK